MSVSDLVLEEEEEEEVKSTYYKMIVKVRALSEVKKLIRGTSEKKQDKCHNFKSFNSTNLKLTHMKVPFVLYFST